MIRISMALAKKKYPKGNKEPIIEMMDGMYHGRFIVFGNNNLKIVSKQYKKGIQHGPYKKWDWEGRLTERCNYCDGIIHGRRINYDRTQNIETIEYYNMGVLDGKRSIYVGNKLYMEMTYDMGFLHGDLTFYNQNELHTIHFEYGLTENNDLISQLRDFAPQIVISI
jgi:antitoxin component YwqK of YwqJK toxin-antitoxin module